MSQNQNIQSGLIEFLKNHSQSNETEFSGGRISTFSAKLGNEPITFNFKKLPDTEISNILKFSKVVPSLPKNYSGVTQNYIYVYLDPFKPAPTSQGFLYKLPYAINGAPELRFGFEPFYFVNYKKVDKRWLYNAVILSTNKNDMSILHGFLKKCKV